MLVWRGPLYFSSSSCFALKVSLLGGCGGLGKLGEGRANFCGIILSIRNSFRIDGIYLMVVLPNFSLGFCELCSQQHLQQPCHFRGNFRQPQGEDALLVTAATPTTTTTSGYGLLQQFPASLLTLISTLQRLENEIQHRLYCCLLCCLCLH